MPTQATKWNTPQDARDYRRVEKALHYLNTHRQTQPDLDEVARAAGLSPYHFQRLFQRWAGVSPKRFLQFLTKEHAKTLLDGGISVLETSHAVGLSGAGRLHDLFVTAEAVSPGEYKSAGSGIAIRWGKHASPFGPCFIATNKRGVCALAFADDDDAMSFALEELRGRWPLATIDQSQRDTGHAAREIFGGRRAQPLNVLLRGTPFQLKVWEAMLRIPEGQVSSYSVLAEAIGQPRAARAVGSAVAKNPVAYLIPCHRVIRSIGEFGDYHWGPLRKRAILGWEASRYRDLQ